jgi:hypothetical protein
MNPFCATPPAKASASGSPAPAPTNRTPKSEPSSPAPKPLPAPAAPAPPTQAGMAAKLAARRAALTTRAAQMKDTPQHKHPHSNPQRQTKRPIDHSKSESESVRRTSECIPIAPNPFQLPTIHSHCPHPFQLPTTLNIPSFSKPNLGMHNSYHGGGRAWHPRVFIKSV